MNNSALLGSFICPICLDYSENPVNSSCCEAIYCKDCVKDIQTCSMCRSKCVFKESLFAKRLINAIEVSCDCGYKCTRGDLNEHQNKCETALISCPIAKCEKKIKKIECFEHIGKEHSVETIHKINSVLQVFKSNDLKSTTVASNAPTSASSNTNTITIDAIRNRFGSTARLGKTGKYYCGRRLDGPACSCCNGYCGTHTGCNCSDCMEFDIRQGRNLPSGWLVNRHGYAAKKSGDLFYCGRLVMEGVENCDGYCGPNDGPNCDACRILGIQTRPGGRYANLMS